jgi:hypothetical protein
MREGPERFEKWKDKVGREYHVSPNNGIKRRGEKTRFQRLLDGSRIEPVETAAFQPPCSSGTVDLLHRFCVARNVGPQVRQDHVDLSHYDGPGESPRRQGLPQQAAAGADFEDPSKNAITLSVEARGKALYQKIARLPDDPARVVATRRHVLVDVEDNVHVLPWFLSLTFVSPPDTVSDFGGVGKFEKRHGNIFFFSFCFDTAAIDAPIIVLVVVNRIWQAVKGNNSPPSSDGET